MKYTTFNGVTLPTYNPEHDLFADSIVPAEVSLPGRAPFDGWDADTAVSVGNTVSVRCVASAASWTALDTTLDSLRALIGVRGSLVMTMEDASTRSRLARCESVDIARTKDYNMWQPIDLSFRLYGEHWQGASNSDVVTLSTTTTEPTINNGGNRDTSIVAITVTPAGTTMTQCDIYNLTTGYGTHMRYTGNVSAGDSLVIDVGAATVYNDGAEAYSGFSLESGHVKDNWLILAPGNNSIRIVIAGGTGGSATFDFYDAWA